MYNKECKTCGKNYDTEHDYATECAPCYFKGKKDSEKKEVYEHKPEPHDNLVTVLTRIANSLDRLVNKLGDK